MLSANNVYKFFPSVFYAKPDKITKTIRPQSDLPVVMCGSFLFKSCQNASVHLSKDHCAAILC